jgi:hypothetical protein
MADEKTGSNVGGATTTAGEGTLSVSAVRVLAVQEGFPQATLPTIFADGIVNVAPSANVLKFYLYRSDPEQAGKGEYKNQVVAQVVMPMLGFLHAALFFEKAVKQFTAQGVLPADLVESIRKSEGL